MKKHKGPISLNSKLESIDEDESSDNYKDENANDSSWDKDDHEEDGPSMISL